MLIHFEYRSVGYFFWKLNVQQRSITKTVTCILSHFQFTHLLSFILFPTFSLRIHGWALGLASRDGRGHRHHPRLGRRSLLQLLHPASDHVTIKLFFVYFRFLSHKYVMHKIFSTTFKFKTLSSSIYLHLKIYEILLFWFFS